MKLLFMTVASTVLLLQGDPWDTRGETTIETQVGENPPAQAFMLAMNADSGIYRHLWRIRREPQYTVELWVGSPIVRDLAYSWADGRCRYWSGEEEITRLQIPEEQICRLILGAIVDRAWDQIHRDIVYPVRAKRLGLEVFVLQSGNAYCRFSGRSPRMHHWLVDYPNTLSECLRLFDGVIRGKSWETQRLRPWLPQ